MKKSSKITLRPATPDDAPAIAEIYRPYVETTAITFEYTAPNETEFRRRIASTLENYPYLTAVSENRIIGYAYAGRYHARAAYDWCAELSIYLDMNERGKGTGRRLYDALTGLLTLQNVQNLYAIITIPNEPSMHFHENLGFKTVCVHENCGYKLGQWRGVSYLEKFIGDHPTPPPKFVRFPELDEKSVADILSNG